MEGGVLTVVGLFVMALLFGIFPELTPEFRALPPLEQNLTRAANGFALMVILLVGFYRLCGGPSVVFADLDDFTAHPGNHWMAITGVALFFYGLLRFIQGVCSCWGCRDGALTNRAFFTTTLGMLAAWFLWVHQGREFLSNGWLVLGWRALLIICAWVALTGFVRFVVLIVGGSNAPRKLFAFLNGKYAPTQSAAISTVCDWAAELKEAFKWHWHNEFKPRGQREKPQTFAQHVAGWVTGLVSCAVLLFLISLGHFAWSKVFPPPTRTATAEVASAMPSPTPRAHHAKHHHATEPS